jgi:dihydroneopterin aldolase
MIVKIENLRFKTVIGVLEHERTTPQEIRIDAVFEYEYEPGNYLDYALAARLIEEHMQKMAFRLLEEALISLHDMLKLNFPFIKSLTITIAKPHILPNCTPSVTLQRRFI